MYITTIFFDILTKKPENVWRGFQRNIHSRNLCTRLLISLRLGAQHSVGVYSPVGSSDHIRVSGAFSVSAKRITWIYVRADWVGLNNYLNKVVWSSYFLARYGNVATNMIADTVSAAMPFPI